MKTTFTEYNGCFGVDLSAETIDEAALLTRFAINRTTEIRIASGFVSQSGEFNVSIVLGKRKQPTGEIPHKP